MEGGKVVEENPISVCGKDSIAYIYAFFHYLHRHLRFSSKVSWLCTYPQAVYFRYQNIISPGSEM